MAKPNERVARKLAAILAADVAGYARLMGLDEVGTLRLLTERRQIMDGVIAEHGGRIVNTAGDGVLAEFPSAVDAVQCATETQEPSHGRAQAIPRTAGWSFASACTPATSWCAGAICSGMA
jgi:class 3 adenylate cyclase